MARASGASFTCLHTLLLLYGLLAGPIGGTAAKSPSPPPSPPSNGYAGFQEQVRMQSCFIVGETVAKTSCTSAVFKQLLQFNSSSLAYCIAAAPWGSLPHAAR